MGFRGGVKLTPPAHPGLTYILLRSKGFTEQSFAIKNKFLPRTVLRSFLHKTERNQMQSLELASIVS